MEFIVNDLKGGDSRTAFQIFDGLKGRVPRATVGTLAASAGVIILMAADRISMARGAKLMLHEPSLAVCGGRARLATALQSFDECAARCISIISERRGIKRKSVEKWILSEADNYFTADEALRAGLVDEVFDMPEALTEPRFNFAVPDGPHDDGKAALALELLQTIGPIQCGDREKFGRELFHYFQSQVR